MKFLKSIARPSLIWMALSIPLVLHSQPRFQRVFSNLSFSNPVDIHFSSDGSRRCYVVEQRGTIKVFTADEGTTTSSIFLDLRDSVIFSGELGLLGLAFHPNFASNGYVYVDYTASNPLRTVIARYQVPQGNPNKADSLSKKVLLEIAQPYSNHNGGQLAFGPDGYLYIAMGDGGSGGDPQNYAQNRSSLLGKILRIDVDATVPGKSYAIPPDNPFVGNSSGWREEIYAYGLRNPWRFSFDPVTQKLWAGDVGQNAFEEIDIIEKGGNYGWRIMEGFACYNPSSGCDTTGLKLPIWQYGRSEGYSITGGLVYRGTTIPSLVGKYIYGDFVTGKVWALSYGGPGTISNVQLQGTDHAFAAFGADSAGEIYGCNYNAGTIMKLVGGPTRVPRSRSELPERMRLDQNFPNPFNPATIIRYSLSSGSAVELRVFDMLGREVDMLVDTFQPSGEYSVTFEGRSLASGVYTYQLRADGAPPIRRSMILLR